MRRSARAPRSPSAPGESSVSHSPWTNTARREVASGKARAQRAPARLHGHAVAADLHLEGQRGRARRDVVPVDAVERAEPERRARSAGQRRVPGGGPPGRKLRSAPGQRAQPAAHPAVDGAADAIVDRPHRGGGGAEYAEGRLAMPSCISLISAPAAANASPAASDRFPIGLAHWMASLGGDVGVIPEEAGGWGRSGARGSSEAGRRSVGWGRGLGSSSELGGGRGNFGGFVPYPDITAPKCPCPLPPLDVVPHRGTNLQEWTPEWLR